jgi:aryl-alcohol dehydrogenase-like predicted oxidoreductase
MAKELGLGVLPWGPLKSGALTGKYTRANGVKMQGLRAGFLGDFTEKQYDVIDAVVEVAAQCNASCPAVALAWLKAQSGVSSTIIGARTLDQLKGNLKAFEVTLTPEQITRLTNASKPTLNFPADFLMRSPSVSHAGATVNGVPSERIFLVPDDHSPRW